MSDHLSAEERELVEWLAKVYREVGVTPKLREAYEFYHRHYATPTQGDDR